MPSWVFQVLVVAGMVAVADALFKIRQALVSLVSKLDEPPDVSHFNPFDGEEGLDRIEEEEKNLPPLQALTYQHRIQADSLSQICQALREIAGALKDSSAKRNQPS
jgi:hypothetical protein